MNKNIKSIIISASLMVLAVACDKNSEPAPSIAGNEKRGIFALSDTEANDIFETEFDFKQFTDILDDGFINDYSVIYISQKGQNNIEPDFEDLDSDNLYAYMYYDNPSATWEAGYNFAPVGNKELDWENIRQNGMEGNSYIFYSMYFPEDNKVRFEVEADQSVLTNLKKSNILGARHTTADLNSRLRFRFYHLMVYLNVTLYVPVFDSEDNSGFLAGALDAGTVLDINRHFRINYSGDPGADQSPVVQLVDDAPLENVKMYIHPESEETYIDISDYYPLGDGGMEKVRKYTLSVLFPAGLDVQNRNFLRFTLHSPGGTEKNYLFSTQQISSANALQLSKGMISSLALYLPRHENNTILIDAEIIDWKNTSSEMNVVEEGKE